MSNGNRTSLEETTATMRALANMISSGLNGNTAGRDPSTTNGFILLTFPYSAASGNMFNYIGNVEHERVKEILQTAFELFDAIPHKL